MSDYGNSATLQLFGLGHRLFRWIGGSIDALVAHMAGSAAAIGKCRTMVRVSEAGTEILSRGKQGKWSLAARLEGDAAGQLSTGLKGRSRRNIALRLASGRAVVQELVLPLGARDVLPAIIRNKVESLAPWPLAEVMWGYRILGQQAGQLTVEVGIVSRKSITSLLGMARAAGASVACVDIAAGTSDAEGIAIDFLGANRLARSRRALRSVMGLSAALALAACAYGSYLAYGSYNDLAATEARIAELKASLVGGGVTGGGRLAEANVLYTRKLETRPVVAVLDALTGIVPDDTWLSVVDLAGNQITIAGHGQEVQGIVEKLESSAQFSSVNFASATQRDTDINADSFSISAAVEPQGSAP